MSQIWVAVITAAAALLGVIVTATVNHVVQRANSANLLRIEELRIENGRLQAMATERTTALGEIHIALSRVARQFSQSTLVAMLDAKMSVQDYDATYAAECERFDRARFLVALHGAQAEPQLEDIYSHMNIFWGNARGALADMLVHNSVEKSSSFQGACDEARTLARICADAKDRLLEGARYTT